MNVIVLSDCRTSDKYYVCADKIAFFKEATDIMGKYSHTMIYLTGVEELLYVSESANIIRSQLWRSSHVPD